MFSSHQLTMWVLTRFEVARGVPTPHNDNTTVDTSNADNEDVVEDGSSSETLIEEYHVCGDIVQVCSLFVQRNCKPMSTHVAHWEYAGGDAICAVSRRLRNCIQQ
jgi:hypothetical protein